MKRISKLKGLRAIFRAIDGEGIPWISNFVEHVIIKRLICL
ncbi:hypothetical protein [Peribacillus simplex]